MGSASMEGDDREDEAEALMDRGTRKDKGLVVSSMPPAVDSPDGGIDSPSLPRSRLSARNASSKYDFVKVKVWLGGNADHYYVLSRFLLSRMLTVTKIPNHVAVKIALELKKLLVDNSLLDVSQSDLEANLFKLMERRGFGEEYINRYRMMTRFHHQRVPLVILVCGTACAGKSTIATLLAQRLNLPNVLQTDMVYELLRTSTDAPLASTPVWAREFNSSEELITEFCRECRIVRKGLAGDLKKAMKDGKPIIIEGIHLDPSIYLMDDENRESGDSHKKGGAGAAEDPSLNVLSLENVCANADHVENNQSCPVVEEQHTHKALEDAGLQETLALKESAYELQGEIFKDSDLQRSDLGKKERSVAELLPGEGDKDSDLQASNNPKIEKSASEPIIVPIVLKMAEFDHKALLEEWISTRTFGDKCILQDQEKLTSNLKTIQDYLCSFEAQGLTVVNISATTFTQTLDSLHNYLLQCIEQGVSAASSKNCKRKEEE
ncbi:putative P-loop containing nucleoside triphosphate hydrolase [Dioscorea sansibarensis]